MRKVVKAIFKVSVAFAAVLAFLSLSVFARSLSAEANYSTIFVDGVAERAWEKAQAYKIEKIDTIMVPSNTDVTGEIKLLWDKEYLYVYVTVDKAGQSICSSYENEQNDSVEVFLTEKGIFDKKNNVTDEKSPDAGAFRIDSRGILSGYGGYYNVVKDRYKGAFSLNSNGYAVELAIPFFSLTPKDGDVLSVEAHINVNSSGNGRDGIVTWMSENSFGWRDSAEHGALTLIEDKSPDTDGPVDIPAAPTHDNGAVVIAGVMLLTASSCLIKKHLMKGKCRSRKKSVLR